MHKSDVQHLNFLKDILNTYAVYPAQGSLLCQWTPFYTQSITISDGQ